MTIDWRMYTLSFLLGMVVGFSELLSRYDSPGRAIINSRSCWLYLILNGSTSLIGYCAAIEWNLQIGLAGKSEFWRVFFVSIMAMAFLRSSFATMKIGDKSVGLGLVTLVDVFMRRAERGLDQDLNLTKWDLISPAVSKLTFNATHEYLVSVTLTHLGSLTDEERTIIESEVSKLKTALLSETVKMQFLSMFLVGKLGIKLFTKVANEAAKIYADEIRLERMQRQRDIATLAALKSALDK